VFYSVTADSHLPDDPGFVPPEDAAALIPPALPALAKELDVEPSNSDSNNREFERHKNSLAQINRLCALLRDCNPG